MENPKCADTNEDLSSEENTLHCLSCKISFKTSGDLLKHNRRSHKRREFYCASCGKSFMYESSLICHLDNCNVSKQFPCSICGQINSSITKLNEHEKQHNNDDVVCELCCETFKREELDKHNEIHKGRRYIECDFCETICIDELVLQTHLASHEKEKQDVARSTTKEREKQSESCFKDKQQTNKKTIQCNICRKKFFNQRNLNQHLRIHHKSSLEKPSKSIRCNKKQPKQKQPKNNCFQNNEPSKPPMKSLKDEQTIQEEKTISCTPCGKKFCTKYQHKNHKRFCKKIKYKCPKCKKGYSKKIYLTKHVCLNNDVYKCNVCGVAFDFKEDLFKHFFVHKSLQGIDLFI